MRDLRKILIRLAIPLLVLTLVPFVGAAPAYAYTLPSPLGTVSGGWGMAWAINSSDQIVGTSDWMPVLWLGSYTLPLPLPPGYVGGTARDINNHGAIVGHVWDSNGVL